MLYYRFYDELPASRAPSSSLAGSRAPLPCITCYPSVPRLHHMHSSSLAVSHAPLQFPNCITCYPRVHKMYHAPPPFGDTWRGKLSLYSPFVTFIDFTLRGGGGGGVQAYHFGKKYFELRVGGGGQDTSQNFEGSFVSMRAILPKWGLRAKTRAKTKIWTKGNRA